MQRLSQADRQEKKYASDIQALAQQYHIREDIVRNLYERELQRFSSTDHIEQYLSLLTSRHVKELIRMGLIEPE